jgi:hypothetical protein
MKDTPFFLDVNVPICPPRRKSAAAVMQTHQISHIISTDKHFDQIADMTRLDPQALFETR